MTAYRYPTERLILFATLFLVFLLVAITATTTFCLSAAFVFGYIGLAYWSIRSHHNVLLQRGHQLTREQTPDLYALVQKCSARLQTEPVDTFVGPAKTMNAYTFGLSAPKVVVLYGGLIERLRKDELAFVIGHELGHVQLGHTWLNTLIGGLAGIPAPAAGFILLQLIFRFWNRACEYSADRAGLLACGDLKAAASALIKIEAGPNALNQAELEAAYHQIDAEDDTLSGSMRELLRSHPLTINRIEALRKFAQSRLYTNLQAKMENI